MLLFYIPLTRPISAPRILELAELPENSSQGRRLAGMTARAVERRIVTVLFADLVGFTSLSERLDAEDVSLVQDAYFDAVRETIDRHGGSWKSLSGTRRWRSSALRASVTTMRSERFAPASRSSEQSRESAPSLGLEEEVLRIRVGVNSGEAVYGEATADRGPVTGDTVNVAARLQAAAEPGSRRRR